MKADIQLDHIVRHLDGRLPQFLDDLKTLVSIDSGTFNKSGNELVGQALQSEYRKLGGRIETHPQSEFGDAFSVHFSGDGGKSVLLLGHTDTVFPDGTAATRPFTVEGERCFGPGAADMKSGDLAIVYALEALTAEGWTGFGRIEVLHNTDEEVGSPASRALVRQCADTADYVLVLEPGRESGAVVSARKGIADFQLRVSGRSAHAGVNHEQGRSAALELAHLVVALEAINGTIPGVTLNVGHVESGDRANVVPDSGFAHLELRATDQASLDRAVNQVQQVVARRTVEGTEAVLDTTIAHLPMYRTAEIEALVELARIIAGRIGFELTDTATGGASDGNTAAAAGRPVLDGLGPIGGRAHSPEEYVLIPSIVPRVSLLAGLISALGSR